MVTQERETVEDKVLKYLDEPGDFRVRPWDWKVVILFQFKDSRFPRTEIVGSCENRDVAWELINRMKSTIEADSTVIGDEKSLTEGSVG